MAAVASASSPVERPPRTRPLPIRLGPEAHASPLDEEKGLSAPLLDRKTSSHSAAEGRNGSRLARRCLGWIDVQSEKELCKVLNFLGATFLANAFFVIGRNIGTVIFLQAMGSEHLTYAIFLSGMGTLVAGQIFSSLSRGRSTIIVNGWLLSAGAIVMSSLYAMALYSPSTLSEASGPERLAAYFVFYSIYIAEDIFSNFVAMQCASVSQSAFSVQDAKRLFGKVQLGNSLAAMSIGLSIGSLAKIVGTLRLLLVQVAVLLLLLLLNVRIERLYVHESGGGKSKRKARSGGTPGEAEHWWQNWLILAMGLWGFTVIFTKTMYEYEYNVLVNSVSSAQEMVALTGYLYAGAGLTSTLINLLGTKLCLDYLGMRGAILATPAALLSVSLAILKSPSVETTFAGRLVDLSLRWSLNNTVRTVLWIAVPASQAAVAKPWVEGSIKKLGQAFNAVVISVALFLSGKDLSALSFLSMAFSALLFLCCVRVYRLYIESMLTRIKRREVGHQILEQLPEDQNFNNVFKEKLLHGGTVVQLDTLLQMGEGLSHSDWVGFFSRFHEMPPTVQLKVIELSRKQRFRVQDDFLLDLIADCLVQPAVLETAILAVGDRRLYAALEPLEAQLDHPEPGVRAAAAVSVLRIGWGVGLGAVSSAALLVLEEMLDFTLGGNLGEEKEKASDDKRRSRGAALAILARRGVRNGPEPSLEDLESLEQQLEQEWEAALDARNLGQGAALALQLTHVKADLKQERRRRAEAAAAAQPPLALSRTSSPVMRPKLPPEWEAGRQQELAVALQMVQLLPEPRTLVPLGTWLRLLCHPADKVRAAALAFVSEEDAKYHEVLESLVWSLQFSETYNAAEAALHALNRPLRVQEAVMDKLMANLEQHRQDVSRLGWGAEGAESAEEPPSMTSTMNMIQLLKFLKRQCAWAGADLPALQASDLCDRLLNFSAELWDADTLQELYQTAVDLKDQGFAVTKELAESRIRTVALQMCKGLAVQKWMRHCSSKLSGSQLAVLQRCLELPVALGSTGEAAGPPEQEEDDDGFHSHSAAYKQEANKIFQKIGLGYVDEQIYLDRLQLLQLAFLAAPRMPNYRSTRVLAAWRLLRDHNATSEAAVLELLDSMLPISLKGIVIPLLDRSPLEKKLAVGASLSPELREVLEPTTGLAPLAAPPPWTGEYFRSCSSVLGAQLAETLLCVAGGAAAPPSETVPTSAARMLLPKMVLLSHVSLYAGLLSIHLAEIALVASLRHCPQGAFLCQKEETYVVVRGTFRSSDYIARRGCVVQEFQAICKDLPAMQVECTSPGGGTVLCVKRQGLFDLMVRLTPKFALGLLKSLVKSLPAPSQIGGKRVIAALEKTRTTRFSTAEIDALPEHSRAEALEARDSVHSNAETIITMQVTEAGYENELYCSSSGTGDMALLFRQVEQEENTQSAGEDVEQSKSLPAAQQPDSEYNFVSPEEHPATGQDRESFSLLEKVVLLQGVKMFRHVPQECLPSIAGCCTATFVERNSIVCRQGEPTSATLFVVADGALGLFKALRLEPDSPRSPTRRGKSRLRFGTLGLLTEEEEDLGTMLRKLLASDTMGNTALLCDTEWAYSAKALEDTWLVCLNRRDLTDALRGRREMASAVIRGLYKTFTRRIQQLENSALVRADTAM